MSSLCICGFCACGAGFFFSRVFSPSWVISSGYKQRLLMVTNLFTTNLIHGDDFSGQWRHCVTMEVGGAWARGNWEVWTIPG